MYDALERIEAGTAAYRRRRRRRLNRLVDTTDRDDGDDDIDEEYNLVDDIPDYAWQLWQDMPDDPRDPDYLASLPESVEVVDVMDDDDDLDTILATNTADNLIVNLGSGTYELREMAFINDRNLFGIVGDGSEAATIEWNNPNPDTAGEYLLESSDEDHGYELLFTTGGGSIDRGYLYGVTVDITGSLDADLTPDAGIIRAHVEHEFWANDVTLRGQRKRQQDLGGGSEAPTGYNSTWEISMLNSDATAFQNEIRFEDGSIFTDVGREDHKGQGGGFSHGDDHEGISVFKECNVYDWASQGFYLSNRAGSEYSRNVLWDCHTKDCSGGMMRIGHKDTIVGGKSERHNPPAGLPGKPLDIEEGTNVRVIGLEIDATDYARSAILVRKEAEQIELDRVVLRTGGDPADSRPIRFSTRSSEPIVDIDISDCYWYDESISVGYETVEIARANVTANGWHLYSKSNPEVVVDEGSSLVVDNEQYGAGTYTAAELGLDDPRPLPKYRLPNEY